MRFIKNRPGQKISRNDEYFHKTVDCNVFTKHRTGCSLILIAYTNSPIPMKQKTSHAP